LRAQGRRGFDGVAGSTESRGQRRRGLGEDDGAVGLGTAWVDSVMGSRMVSGAQCHGLGEDNVVAGSGTASRAWGRHLCG
jgi:hypothetical protein